MNNKEKTELIFSSLNDGFEVVAERSDGKLSLKAVAFLQGKCVGFVLSSDGKFAPCDVSNVAIYRTKSEKICDAQNVESPLNNADAISAVASEFVFH